MACIHFLVILCLGCSTPPISVGSQDESSLISESEQTSISSSAGISQGEKADSATPIFITVNETATIFLEGYPIDTLPWDMEGQETIGQSEDYIGRDIVTAVVKTNDGTYAYVWIAELGFAGSKAQRSKKPDFQPTDYSDYITLGGSPITSSFGDSEDAGCNRRYLGPDRERVLFVYESADGEYVHAKTLINEGIGWLEKEALGLTGEEQVGMIAAEDYTVVIHLCGEHREVRLYL